MQRNFLRPLRSIVPFASRYTSPTATTINAPMNFPYDAVLNRGTINFVGQFRYIAAFVIAAVAYLILFMLMLVTVDGMTWEHAALTFAVTAGLYNLIMLPVAWRALLPRQTDPKEVWKLLQFVEAQSYTWEEVDDIEDNAIKEQGGISNGLVLPGTLWGGFIAVIAIFRDWIQNPILGYWIFILIMITLGSIVAHIAHQRVNRTMERAAREWKRRHPKEKTASK